MLKRINDILEQCNAIRTNNSRNNPNFKKDQRVRTRHDPDTPFDFFELRNSWELIVGKMLIKHTTPLRIYKKRLIIMAKEPIFSHVIRDQGPKILEKIYHHFPKLRGQVKGLGHVTSDHFFQEKAPETKKTNPREIFTKEEMEKERLKNLMNPHSPHYKAAKEKAEKTFSHLEDPELKNIFMKLFIERVIYKEEFEKN